jgi:hypothetical protein
MTELPRMSFQSLPLTTVVNRTAAIYLGRSRGILSLRLRITRTSVSDSKGQRAAPCLKSRGGKELLSYSIPCYRNWSEGGDQVGQVAGEPFTDNYGVSEEHQHIYTVLW